MGHLDNASDLGSMSLYQLWVIYGKSASGKTTLASTFPKPILYLSIGDSGYSSIADIKGIKGIEITGIDHLDQVLAEAEKDRKYKTVVLDTFGLLLNEWIDANSVVKKKRMTQQMYGDLKVDIETYVRKSKAIAKNHITVLICHEETDSFEGMEDELTPDVRPKTSKGAKSYLEGMANYGIHTTILHKTKTVEGKEKTFIKHAVHLAEHPYYWVKTQKPASIVLPALVLDPTYDKIMNFINGGTK